jgi:hypothetical protein
MEMLVRLMGVIMELFTKGAASIIIQEKMLTDKEMNKGRGANRNPYFGRVLMRKTFSGYVMGTDYARSVANAATRMGNETSAEEVNLKSNWHKPLNGEYGEWFSTDKATESKIYLKLQRNEEQIAHKITTEYYLDGHLATDEERASIEAWLKKKSSTQSSTQTDLGLNKENEQHFMLPQLDTITYIKQGDKELKPHEVFAMAMAVA